MGSGGRSGLVPLENDEFDIAKDPEKEGAEPKPPTEPPARGVENVPRPTPLSGRGCKALLLYVKVCRFSVKQRLDARASVSIVVSARQKRTGLYVSYERVLKLIFGAILLGRFLTGAAQHEKTHRSDYGAATVRE